MDEEVARTLGELELKLRELERELTAIGQSQAQPGEHMAPPPPPHRHAQAGAPVPPPPPLGGSATPAISDMTGRLVDEAIEQRFSMESRETVYGEIPATKDRHEAIDIADLVRFKETMQRTLQGLIDQYSRLLSIEPPSHD